MNSKTPKRYQKRTHGHQRDPKWTPRCPRRAPASAKWQPRGTKGIRRVSQSTCKINKDLKDQLSHLFWFQKSTKKGPRGQKGWQKWSRWASQNSSKHHFHYSVGMLKHMGFWHVPRIMGNTKKQVFRHLPGVPRGLFCIGRANENNKTRLTKNIQKPSKK